MHTHTRHTEDLRAGSRDVVYGEADAWCCRGTVVVAVNMRCCAVVWCEEKHRSVGVEAGESVKEDY